MKKLFILSICFLFFVIGTNSYSGDLFDRKTISNALLEPAKRTQLVSAYFNPLSYSYQDTADVLSREHQLSMLPGYKLPKKALLLSALMPGAGELYVKSYFKAATFFLVEVGAWTFYGIYTKKGNEKEVEYEAYADEKWNPEKWKSWYDGLDPSTQESFTHTTHMLELLDEGRKTQQYYEMIGKYAEFVTGWEGTRNDLTFGELMGYRQDKVQIADDYMDMRAESNDLFSLARTGITVAMINHLLSAIDAAWTAKITNNRLLKTSMRIEQKHYVNHVLPVLSLKFNW
ncbi:hypothetical protein H8E88_16565 [candidate division KSB1 bacterium]|nr:hypothetical protein [candidate division KSB1 bacterium]MBL7094054.1 hypothetical protein [candidate division KSB1 bacterium]